MSLDAWFDTHGKDRTIIVVGDSIAQGTFDPTTGYVARLRTKLDRWGNGGFGYYGLWRPEWEASGSWTNATGANAWDHAPWGQIYTASGSSNIYTWTNPDDPTPAFIQDLYYSDPASAANFSYRVDGGAWTNIAGTFASANAWRTYPLHISAVSTFEVRAANAAGTSVATYFGGMNQRSSNELVIHNLGFNGNILQNFTRTASAGDPFSFFTSNPPDLVICHGSNEVVFAVSQAQWESDLEDIAAAALAQGAPTLFMTTPEQNDGRDTTQQTLYRQTMRDVAAGGDLLDMAPLWGTYADADAAGLWFNPPGVHPSDTGHEDIATRMALRVLKPNRGALLRRT